MSNSRLASSPTTKKKIVISPVLIQCRRSWETPEPPKSSDSRVPHKASYDGRSTLAHASAASVAARRITALPVSVRRNSRSGVSTRRAQTVLPKKGVGASLGPVTSHLTASGARAFPSWAFLAYGR